MATPVRWKFVLANTVDLSNIAELNSAHDKNVTIIHNRPGSATFSLSMTDALAGLINPLATALKCYRIGSDGVARNVWSGYVNTIDEDVSNNKMTVNCIGWLQRLDMRILRRDLNFPYVAATSTDDAEIIHQLLTEANTSPSPSGDGYTIRTPTGAANQNTPTLIGWGGTLPNEGTGGATAYVPAYRGKNYQKYQKIGSAIQEFTEIENGCDICVDPDTRMLNVYRKKMIDRTSVIFGFNWGPNNLAQFNRQIDGQTVVNYELIVGRYASAFADDVLNAYASQLAYGLIEEQQALSDVVDPAPPAPSVLTTFAAAEILLRQQPRSIYSVTPQVFVPGGRVPEPFVQYGVGDKVYFSARWLPRVNIQNQAVRIFGMSFTIDDEGNERPGPLQITPGG